MPSIRRPPRSVIILSAASRRAITRRLHPNHASAAVVRSYATHKSLPRKSITVLNDDGRRNWGELSAGEKVARSTQQSVNFLVVIAGVVLTGGVATFLFTDIFSPESKTSIFNRAVDRVKADPRCIELLGNPKKILAHGGGDLRGWTRHRPIPSRVEKDKIGTEHFYMHFDVDGPLNRGTVNVHMTKRSDQSSYGYRILALDVPGHERIYLENADATKLDNRGSGKMFGVRWW